MIGVQGAASAAPAPLSPAASLVRVAHVRYELATHAWVEALADAIDARSHQDPTWTLTPGDRAAIAQAEREARLNLDLAWLRLQAVRRRAAQTGAIG